MVRLHILNLMGLLLSAVGPSSAVKIVDHKGACNVTTDEGRIDLSSLGNTDGTARFTGLNTGDGSDYIYDWNPCQDFTETKGGGGVENQCKKVAICQSSSYGITSFISFGKTSTASWSVADDGNVTLLYNDGSPSKAIQTSVKLICTEGSSTDDVKVLPQEDYQKLNFELRSKHCCAVPLPKPAGGSSGLSTGSILCIILLVVVSLYILGGLIFTVGYKKSEGRQRIPNVEFWTSMPGLVKDGAKFTLCCGWKQTGTSKYENI